MSNTDGDNASEQVQVAFASGIPQVLHVTLMHVHRLFVECQQTWDQVGFPDPQDLFSALALCEREDYLFLNFESH